MIKTSLRFFVILCGGVVFYLWLVFRETCFMRFIRPVIDKACCMRFFGVSNCLVSWEFLWKS
jgi:hypothetical protein